MPGIDVEQQVGDFLGDEVPENFKKEEQDDFESFIGSPPEEDSNKGSDDSSNDDSDSGDKDDKGSDDDDKGSDDDKGDDKSGESDDDKSKDSDDDKGSDSSDSNDNDDNSDSSSDDDSKLTEPSAELLELRELIRGQNTTIEEMKLLITSKADDKIEKPKAFELNEDELNFVTAEDIDDVLADAGKLNALLGKIINIAVGHSVKSVSETIPTTISGQMTQQLDIRDFVRDFYVENKDLAAVKKTVGAIANEIQASNKDWALDKIFKETAIKTRKTLGMSDPADRKESDDGKDKNKKTERSALPPGYTGSRKGASKSKGVQGEIDELL